MPNSKTSQYIDKITSENDRLRRELKAEKLAREDEAKRIAAAHAKAEDSRTENQHLQVLADTNARAIERKDRKLEELKALLDTEAMRRKLAEQRAEEALKMLGDTRSETQRELALAYEMRGMAETNLETARDGFKRNVPESVAQLTGGEYFPFKNASTHSQHLITISNDAPNYYILSFHRQSQNPGLHALDVKLKDRPGLQSKVRNAYWVDAQPSGSSR